MFRNKKNEIPYVATEEIPYVATVEAFNKMCNFEQQLEEEFNQVDNEIIKLIKDYYCISGHLPCGQNRKYNDNIGLTLSEIKGLIFSSDFFSLEEKYNFSKYTLEDYLEEMVKEGKVHKTKPIIRNYVEDTTKNKIMKYDYKSKNKKESDKYTYDYPKYIKEETVDEDLYFIKNI